MLLSQVIAKEISHRATKHLESIEKVNIFDHLFLFMTTLTIYRQRLLEALQSSQIVEPLSSEIAIQY